MSVSMQREALEGVIKGSWKFATEVAVDDVDCAAQGDRFVAVLERFRQAEAGA